MNKYKKQIKVIERNSKISNDEKIDSLMSLLSQFEEKYKDIDQNYKVNFAENTDKRSRFYWWQMILTVFAGLVTMATATKSLETNDLLTLNNLICAISGTITAAGIGSMFLEESGVPIFKEDREMNELRKLGFACIEIKNALSKLKEESNEKQMQ